MTNAQFNIIKEKTLKEAEILDAKFNQQLKDLGWIRPMTEEEKANAFSDEFED